MAGTLVLAHLLWFVAFALTWGSFWIKISLSAALLACVSRFLDPEGDPIGRLDGRGLLLGAVAAIALYALFWIIRPLVVALFPFAHDQIAWIYQQGEGTPLWLMVMLSLFVTGPGEEYYWRGFVQRRLADRYGRRRGWLLATVLYTAVHIWSLNLVLIGGALLAGAFWGAFYGRLGSLWPVIICHSIWSALALAVLPFG